jgi:hypothetical protein
LGDAAWAAFSPPVPVKDAAGRADDHRVVIVVNAQPVPVSGWYLDRGGDRLFLRSGDPAPICPRHGMPVTRWQLVHALPAPVPPPH